MPCCRDRKAEQTAYYYAQKATLHHSSIKLMTFRTNKLLNNSDILGKNMASMGHSDEICGVIYISQTFYIACFTFDMFDMNSMAHSMRKRNV